MKKYLSTLLLVACVFGLTACGAQKEEYKYDQDTLETETSLMFGLVSTEMSEDAHASIADRDEDYMDQLESALKEYYSIKIDGDVFAKGVESWENNIDVIGTPAAQISTFDVKSDSDEAIIVGHFDGSDHDGEIEVIFDENKHITSITINPKYSMGELMEQATLNTFLGMGTVFCVLILISLIISLFVFIPKIQKAFSNKNKGDIKTEAVNNTIAQIIENEELSDDLEFVAVISAAIAASEGATSTDGFVVRSIKRANTKKWQNA